MPSSKFVHHVTWEDSNCVIIKLIIKSATSDDSGLYYCSLRYDTDIINEEVVSDSGQIDLHIGNVYVNISLIVIIC